MRNGKVKRNIKISEWNLKNSKRLRGRLKDEKWKEKIKM